MKIDLKSGVPIYLQIIEQIKMAVLYGLYRKGDRILPVRELALELRINPNTVAKAYRILQDEKIIESRPGGGNFISGVENDDVTVLREEALREELKKVITKAEDLGIDRSHLAEIFSQLLEEKEEK